MASFDTFSNMYDVVIIGAGAGGGTLAYALKDAGLNILIIERGDFIPQEEENESIDAAYGGPRYGTRNGWKNLYCNSKLSDFGSIYCVGGKTKVYGSALVRFRKEDFMGIRHREGQAPAWPITYEEFEPYYSKAEQLYSVHGKAELEPTEPPHSFAYRYAPLSYDPYIQKLASHFEKQGLHPSPIPLGIIAEKKHLINGRTFDGYPSKNHSKAETDVVCIRPALKTATTTILTKAVAQRLVADETGKKITSVEVLHEGKIKQIQAKRFVLSCGCIHSAELLLKSGVGNSSGLVGKNLMMHTSSAVIWFHPFHKNSSEFQKSFQIMDYYLKGKDGWPWGCIQTLGRMPFGALFPKGVKRLGNWFAGRSMQMVAISEDLPDPKNCVKLDKEGKISIYYRSNNRKTNQIFSKEVTKLLKKSFPLSFAFAIPSSGKHLSHSHACGTLVFGNDPKTSVLDPYCRTHDVENLYVVDSSFFPTSAAVNPALTIMAQALRVGEHLCKLEY
jgi:choline dehydrogenase-like flavoprotein